MKAISLLILLFSCAHEEIRQSETLEAKQLIQCYMESDAYQKKIPFEAKMSMFVSELGTITQAKVLETSSKDANLNTCLTYVLLGAGRNLRTNEKSGVVVRNLKFRPDGNHEL